MLLKYIQKKLITEQFAFDKLDQIYKSSMAEKSSKVIKLALNGLQKQFPENNFATMTKTGAKGSNVNHSQVSALLGQ